MFGSNLAGGGVLTGPTLSGFLTGIILANVSLNNVKFRMLPAAKAIVATQSYAANLVWVQFLAF